MASRRPDDAELLGLRLGEDPSTAALPVGEDLCTPHGFLYGGAGVAACATVAELAVGQPVSWMTVQFVGTGFPGDVVSLDVEALARGRATTQSTVTGRVRDRLIFNASCAHSAREGSAARAWGTMPTVTPPQESGPFQFFGSQDATASFLQHIERRVPPESVQLARQGRCFVWTRLVVHDVGSAATQGFVADIVPMVVGLAIGNDPGGTSLDNTVRIVDDRPTEGWILLDIEAEGYGRQIGHGRVRLWRPDGTLIGTATQSAIIRTSHHRSREQPGPA